MTLLERLTAAGVVPHHRRPGGDDEFYKLVLKYRNEIEAVRAEGFSWRQTFEIFKAACQEAREWIEGKRLVPQRWYESALQRRYWQIKREVLA